MNILWRNPGMIRALFGFVVGGALGFGLVVALRAISGLEIYQTEQTGYPHVVVPAITAPLGFLVGMGCFSYWFRWAGGAPTIPEDHAQHGAKSWKDYFRFNTDHKVIGIQYICTTFFFFIVGGLAAMTVRAELAQPGTQIVDPGFYGGLFSTHAAFMIFLFIIPVFAGIANYVLPLMIGAPDMAFPRLNALSFWMLPMAGPPLPRLLLRPRRRLRRGMDRLRAALDRSPVRPVLLQPRGPVRGRVVGGDRPELPRDDHHYACARNDLLAHAAPGVGEPLDLAPGRRGHAVHRGRPVHGPLRPRPPHELLQRGGRRRRPELPAHLLVLLPPGRLHHDAARASGSSPRSYLRTPVNRSSATG